MTPCEEWTGNRFVSGYGRITGGPFRGARAHRVAWERANGRPVPEGLLVLHDCDNPPCVNPDHLHLGTHADNARERKERDRGVRGKRVNTAKLTASDVLEVRSLTDQGWRHYDIAGAYGVTQPMVGYIARRESWAWLPEQKDPPKNGGPPVSAGLVVRLAR